MRLKNLLLLVSVFSFLQGKCQALFEKSTDSVGVMDFMNNSVSLRLYSQDSDMFVVFISANQCKGCSEKLVSSVSNYASKKAARANILMRVGNNPLARRQQMDAISPFDIYKQFGATYFDTENDSIIGVEPAARIRGNFKKMGIVRTPALLFIPKDISKPSAFYRFDDLFHERSLKLKRNISKQLMIE